VIVATPYTGFIVLPPAEIVLTTLPSSVVWLFTVSTVGSNTFVLYVSYYPTKVSKPSTISSISFSNSGILTSLMLKFLN
jgi:hypothetical protein